MPKTKETHEPKPSKPIILINRTRGRIMVPQPRTDKGGNPQKFACDIHTIHSGLNQPIKQEVFDLLMSSKHRSKFEGPEPELRRLESVGDVPDMAVSDVLQNCSDPPSVKWWASVEKRPAVRAKLDGWLEKIAKRSAKRRGEAA